MAKNRIVPDRGHPSESNSARMEAAGGALSPGARENEPAADAPRNHPSFACGPGGAAPPGSAFACAKVPRHQAPHSLARRCRATFGTHSRFRVSRTLDRRHEKGEAVRLPLFKNSYQQRIRMGFRRPRGNHPEERRSHPAAVRRGAVVGARGATTVAAGRRGHHHRLRCRLFRRAGTAAPRR